MTFTGLPIETVAWIALFSAIAVTVLYLVRLRRRRVEVPFTPLWDAVSDQARTDTDWRRRLKRIVSWLLHIAIAALLVGAALGPHLDDHLTGQRHILILVDDSATMQATDVTGAHDRFESAVDTTADLLDDIGDGDRVMVATFNDRVQPLGPFVDDPSLLEARVRDLQPTARPADLQTALEFGADTLADRPDPELVVVTDGAGLDDAPLRADLDDETTIRHHQVGTSGENLAVTAFNARRYPANRLDHEVFVEARNLLDRPVDATLELWADDRLLETQPLSLQARETHREFFPDLAAAGERLEAHIRLETDDARDVFPLDDTARATIPPPRRLDVRLVSEDNLFLEGPLLLTPHIDVDLVAPGDYEPTTDYDVTIFDTHAFEPPASGDLLYIAPPADASPFEIAGTDDEPVVTDVRDDHTLMRWLSLSDLNIGQISTFETTADDTAVATSFGDPVIVARETDDRRKVAVGFDVRDSDFPLRVGFPVFVLNVMDYFADDTETLRSSYPVGQTWSLPVDTDADTVDIVDPDGHRHTATARDGEALWHGDRPGFYRLETPETSRYLGANLADPDQSDIAPNSLEVDGHEVTTDLDGLSKDRRPVWIGLLLAAFGLLFVEWWTYNRRWTV